MTRNLVNLDRALRSAMPSSLFALEAGLRRIGVIGLVPLLAAATGKCPPYAIFDLPAFRAPQSRPGLTP